MSQFYFTMSDGSGFGFDSVDPENTMLGYSEPDDMGSLSALLDEIDDKLSAKEKQDNS